MKTARSFAHFAFFALAILTIGVALILGPLKLINPHSHFFQGFSFKILLELALMTIAVGFALGYIKWNFDKAK